MKVSLIFPLSAYACDPYQNQHIALLDGDADPDVVLVTDIKVAGAIQNETDLLVFVQMPITKVKHK